MKACSSLRFLLLTAALLAAATPVSAQIYRSEDLPPPTAPQTLPFPPAEAVPTESTAPVVPQNSPPPVSEPVSPGTDTSQMPFDAPVPPAETPPVTAEGTESPAIETAPLAEPEPYVPPVMYAVKLRGLNKVSAKTDSFQAVLGSATNFDNLEVIARACWQAPPHEQPENAALLDIWERKPGESPRQIFVGWMFASSPSLSALEHPVYDITVLECLPLEEGGALP